MKRIFKFSTFEACFALSISCGLLVFFLMSFCFLIFRKTDESENYDEEIITKYESFLPHDESNREFSRDNSGVFSHYPLSSLGTNEYRCSGSCYCHDEGLESIRRSGIIGTRKLMTTYIVAAVNILVAYDLSKDHFSQYCEDNYVCQSSEEAIFSEVERCEPSNNEKSQKKNYDDTEEFRNFRCRGHCVTEDLNKKKKEDFRRRIITVIPHESLELGENEFFAVDRDEWRDWLLKNHDTASEVWLYRWKVHMNQRQVTWDESVEEAICFGWIDSIYRRPPEGSLYELDLLKQRFTPRRSKGISRWSKYNLARAQKMMSEGKMTEAGMKEYRKWVEKHPEDINGVEINSKECSKIKQEKNVKVFVMGEEEDYLVVENIARRKYMEEDLNSFCKHNSFRCRGHDGNFENPTVKCFET